MAEITTHIFMASDVQKIINCDDAIKCFSVGPDAFYFSRKTRNLARIMHRTNTFLFFKNYIDYIKEHYLGNNSYIMGSLYGFLAHYVLDYKVHPYVFYFDHLDKNMHRKIEMGLSKYIISNHNVLPNRYKINKDLNYKKTFELEKLLDYVFYKTYGYVNYGKEYFKCLNKLKRTYRLFRYDRFGIKKFFYRIFDFISGSRIRYVSFYNIDDANLNLERNKWNHPCIKDEIHTESMIDIYNESINKLLDIINKLDFNKDEKYFRSVIGNMSYITGKDSDVRYQMQYFSSKIDF